MTDFVDVLRLARAMPISAVAASAASGTTLSFSANKVDSNSAAKSEKLLEAMMNSPNDDAATDGALTELLHGNQTSGKGSGSTYSLLQVCMQEMISILPTLR